MHQFRLRPARPGDAGFLEEMITEAVNWSPDRPHRDQQELLADPAIAHYVAGWPRPGDLGLVAEDDHGQPIGASWLRFFSANDPGYGFVAADVPEVSIAVSAAWRGRGVGRALLRTLTEDARRAGIQRLSLSVERGNHALDLYRAEGFVIVSSQGGAVTLIKQLGSRPGFDGTM